MTVLRDLPVRLGELKSFSHKFVATKLRQTIGNIELATILQKMLVLGLSPMYFVDEISDRP